MSGISTDTLSGAGPFRKLMQRLLGATVARLAVRYSSRPVKSRVHGSLSRLYHHILKSPSIKGPVIPLNAGERYIIFSDQHKGARDGADDFAFAEKNYLAALDHYLLQGHTYINLGDSEELWENTLAAVKEHNSLTFEKERSFLDRGRFIKIYGNHDLYWDNDPLAGMNLRTIYGREVKIFEGAVLQLSGGDEDLHIFLTHGHQGDLQSDGNWLSKWFISTIWAPLQAYLGINPNTPATNNTLKTDHNRLMYEWSARQQKALLITGHTHQPVFLSLTHLERLYDSRDRARRAGNSVEADRLEAEISAYHLKSHTAPDFSKYRPTYFNSGCCCFSDGDITGIEIDSETIRLIKWEYDDNGNPRRIVLEETGLRQLAAML